MLVGGLGGGCEGVWGGKDGGGEGWRGDLRGGEGVVRGWGW